MRQGHAGNIAHDVHGEPRTVKAVGTGGAVDVAFIQQRLGIIDNCSAHCGGCGRTAGGIGITAVDIHIIGMDVARNLAVCNFKPIPLNANGPVP